MANLFNELISKENLMKRIGDISQIAGAKLYELSTGKAKAVSAVDIKTGTGFEFTVLPDRGMDIAWCSYKGIPISFISKTGVVSPNHYNEEGLGFLRGFYGGLLTTCGLTYMGAPNKDEGENLGLHGRASNTPAEDVSIYQEWEEDEFVIRLRGKIRESRVFGENITLIREIVTRLGSNKIVITDTVENCGFDTQPLMLLYHCNFGYPIVSKDTTLYTNSKVITPRDQEAEKGISEYNTFEEPTHKYAEQVYYHDIVPHSENIAKATLFNPTINNHGLGAYVQFDKTQLPYFIEWKQMGEGDYVVGLEPGTWYPEGRSKARERSELQWLKPGEKRLFHLEIAVIEEL